MEKDSILNVLKQTFKQFIPTEDKRTNLPHFQQKIKKHPAQYIGRFDKEHSLPDFDGK